MSRFEWQSFTFGTVPEELILERLRALNKPFFLSLTGDLSHRVVHAINIYRKVSSELAEAFYYVPRETSTGQALCMALEAYLSLEMAVEFFRNLLLLDDCEDAVREEAESLHSACMQILDIEEI